MTPAYGAEGLHFSSFMISSVGIDNIVQLYYCMVLTRMYVTYITWSIPNLPDLV